MTTVEQMYYTMGKNAVERMYFKLHSKEDYQDSEEIKKSWNILDTFCKEWQGQVFTIDMASDLEEFVMNLCMENEKQGFLYGFQQAMTLTTSK